MTYSLDKFKQFVIPINTFKLSLIRENVGFFLHVLVTNGCAFDLTCHLLQTNFRYILLHLHGVKTIYITSIEWNHTVKQQYPDRGLTDYEEVFLGKGF